MTTLRKRAEQAAGLTVLALLALGIFAVLRPFVAVLLWALILSMATWPVFTWLEHRSGGRPALAATAMTLLLLTALLLPLVLVATSVTDEIRSLAGRVRVLQEEGLTAPPEWLARIPLIGDDAVAQWQSFVDDPEGIREDIKQYVRPALQWTLRAAASIGSGLGQMALSVLIAWFFYRDGLVAWRRLMVVVVKLAGERGPELVAVTNSTMKGVVYGIVGTAFAQGTLAGIGFWVAGVPAAFLLSVLTAFFSVIPLGPVLVWLPAAAWLFFSAGATGWAIFLVAWSVVAVGGVENFIKPIFIGRGSKLPLILVFIGMFGGVVAFGFLGLFIGPTLLAVGYTLLRHWAPGEDAPGQPPDAGGAWGQGTGGGR